MLGIDEGSRIGSNEGCSEDHDDGNMVALNDGFELGRVLGIKEGTREGEDETS